MRTYDEVGSFPGALREFLVIGKKENFFLKEGTDRWNPETQIKRGLCSWTRHRENRQAFCLGGDAENPMLGSEKAQKPSMYQP